MIHCQFVAWVKGRFNIDPPDDLPGWWICSECETPRSIRVRDPDWKGTSRPCSVGAPVKSPPKPRPRGLGDTVAKAIEVAAFGLVKKKSGCGCDKRQKWLNEKFPYRDVADEAGSAAG